MAVLRRLGKAGKNRAGVDLGTPLPSALTAPSSTPPHRDRLATLGLQGGNNLSFMQMFLGVLFFAYFLDVHI